MARRPRDAPGFTVDELDAFPRYAPTSRRGLRRSRPITPEEPDEVTGADRPDRVVVAAGPPTDRSPGLEGRIRPASGLGLVVILVVAAVGIVSTVVTGRAPVLQLVITLVALGVVVAAVRRRRRGGRDRSSTRLAVDRVQIGDDAVTVWSARGLGRRIYKISGDMLVIRRPAQGVHTLTVVGPAGGTPPLPLSGFQEDDLGRAARGRGWRWYSAQRWERALPGWTKARNRSWPPAPPRSVRGTSLDVREAGLDEPTRLVSALVPLTSGAAAALVLASMLFRLDLTPIVWAAALLVLAGIGITVLVLRLTVVRVFVTAEELVLSRGGPLCEVVDRRAIGSVRPGRHWTRLCDEQGSVVLWLPTGQSAEVLSTLASYRRPVTAPPAS